MVAAFSSGKGSQLYQLIDSYTLRDGTGRDGTGRDAMTESCIASRAPGPRWARPRANTGHVTINSHFPSPCSRVSNSPRCVPGCQPCVPHSQRPRLASTTHRLPRRNVNAEETPGPVTRTGRSVDSEVRASKGGWWASQCGAHHQSRRHRDREPSAGPGKRGYRSNPAPPRPTARSR